MERTELPSMKQLRIDRGVTQSHLAGRLGINQAALSRLENRDDVSVSMLKSLVEALGGKLRLSAEFADVTIDLSGFTGNEKLEDLRALVNHHCVIHPMPPERASDEFLVRTVDESLVTLEKLSNHQILEIPIRRVLEVLPATSSNVPTIVLRGSLHWSANEKLWRLAL
jgi:transcriptional regulator with XRE-family HTH domain